MSLPVSFQERATAGKGAAGYPIQISGSDLDRNFTYATLEISDTSPQGAPQPWRIEEFAGPSGYTQRRLIFDPPPSQTGDSILAFRGGRFAWLPVPATGTHVLGAIKGALTWIATEEC